MNYTVLCHKFSALIKRLISPHLKHSQYIYSDTLRALVSQGSVCLDLGCGHEIFPHWMDNGAFYEKNLISKSKIFVGIDYDMWSLKHHKNIPFKLRGNISKLPFKDNMFDFIISNMVVEHLSSPEIQFKEIYRTLKPGGIFIFHTPNKWGYATVLARLMPDFLKIGLEKFLHNRSEKDIFKTYYIANTASSIKSLAKKSGFNVVGLRLLATNPQTVMLPPLVILELLWIKLLLTKPFRKLRTNIVAILKKPLDSFKEQLILF